MHATRLMPATCDRHEPCADPERSGRGARGSRLQAPSPGMSAGQEEVPMTVRRLPGVAIGFALALTLFVSTRCHDSDSVTGPPVGIAGAWTGTWTPTSGQCHSTRSATASFEQDGSSVTGQINIKPGLCDISGRFVGTLTGTSVTGTLSGGVVQGTWNATSLQLNLDGGDETFDGNFDFHR